MSKKKLAAAIAHEMMKQKLPITVENLRKLRKQMVKNVREHCAEIYPAGSVERSACEVAAAVAAAEFTDVAEAFFGKRI
jgi:hypothetical protein